MADLGGRLSWRDLLVIVTQAPPTSAIYRARNPEWSWGLSEQLLAAAVDALHTLAWMQSEDGQRGRNRPKPIPRPGVEPEGQTFGRAADGAGELVDIEAWLAARNPAQHQHLTEHQRPREA